MWLEAEVKDWKKRDWWASHASDLSPFVSPLLWYVIKLSNFGQISSFMTSRKEDSRVKVGTSSLKETHCQLQRLMLRYFCICSSLRWTRGAFQTDVSCWKGDFAGWHGTTKFRSEYERSRDLKGVTKMFMLSHCEAMIDYFLLANFLSFLLFE